MKKVLCMILCIIMVASCLAGCSESAPAATQAAQTEAAAENEAAAESKFAGQTLKVAVFEGGYGSDSWKRVCEAFEKAYGVKVEMQAGPTISDIVRPQMIAGDYPDIYYGNGGATEPLSNELIEQHALEDLSDVFNQKCLDHDILLKDYIVDGYLTNNYYSPYGDGQITMAPLGGSTMGLIYNKKLFADNGWEIPVTWDDFFALGDKAKEKGYALLTYPGIYPSYNEILIFPAIASALGADQINVLTSYDSSVLKTPEMKEVFENIAKIGQEGYLMEGTTALDHTKSQSEFMLDKALFIPNGDWLPAEMAEAPRTDGFEWGCAPIPTLKADDTKYYFGTGDGGVCIPKAAEHKELAKEFIRFIYTDESAKLFAEYGSVVLLTKNIKEVAGDYISDEVKNFSEVGQVASAANYRWDVAENSKVVLDDYLWSAMTDVMNGKMTADEWREGVIDAVDRIKAGE